MSRQKKWFVLALSMASMGCESSASDTAKKDFAFGEAKVDDVGPFDVGVRTIQFLDQNNRTLTADIWYPAIVDETDELAIYEPTIHTRSAYREPNAAEHAAPLVAFSHGLGGIRYQSVYFCERLASHGFAVVAVDHPFSTMFDLDMSRVFESVNNCPGELKSSVDATIEYARNHPKKLKIDGDNYIVSGHSLGTQTALTVAGGRINVESFFTLCEQRPYLTGCSYRDQYDPNTFILEHGDQRVVGLMPMSPGFWHLFGPDGSELERLKESFSLVGDADPVLPYNTELMPTVDALGKPKRAAIFHHAGHYGFSEMCGFAPFLSPECIEEDQGWADIEQVQADSNTLIVAYVGSVHTGDDNYSKWLLPENWVGTSLSILDAD